MFAGEVEGGLAQRAGTRTSPPGQSLTRSSIAPFVEARDREHHLRVAHSVEALFARHHPEDPLLEDRVLVGLFPECLRCMRTVPWPVPAGMSARPSPQRLPRISDSGGVRSKRLRCSRSGLDPSV